MKRNAVVSAAVLFVLLAAFGLVAQRPDRQLTPTSFGTGPIGYKAAYDLLAESGVPVGRNLGRFAALPERATVWWIEPTSLCGAAQETPRPSDKGANGPDSSAPSWSGSGWLERGGTAVVFLPAWTGPRACAGEALPARLEVSEPTPTPPGSEADAAPAVEDDAMQHLGERVDSTPHPVSGARVATPRLLPMPRLGAFAETVDWTAAAAVGGHPFLLERKVGDGRLVIVGDTQFLTNGWLDHGDSAPLVMDIARAYGAPLIDERDHGFGLTGNTAAYLWHSSARGAFLGLALLGVVFAWWGAALPPQSAAGSAAADPTLARYVDSLATLYARAGNHAAVAERYRVYVLGQLRRQSGLAPDTPVDLLVDRLLRQGRIDANQARWLRQPAAVATAAELRQHTRRLDEFLRKAST